MVGLIPLILNDCALSAVYVAIIAAALLARRAPHDTTVFIFGFFAMMASEALFVHTGVETFNRATLFGLMPLWLPLLWGYGFVAIKRAVAVMGR